LNDGLDRRCAFSPNQALDSFDDSILCRISTEGESGDGDDDDQQRRKGEQRVVRQCGSQLERLIF